MQGVTAVSYPQFALLNTFTYNWGGGGRNVCVVFVLAVQAKSVIQL